MARLKLDLLKKTPNSYVTLHELVEMNQKIKTLSLSDRVEKLQLKARSRRCDLARHFDCENHYETGWRQ